MPRRRGERAQERARKTRSDKPTRASKRGVLATFKRLGSQLRTGFDNERLMRMATVVIAAFVATSMPDVRTLLVMMGLGANETAGSAEVAASRGHAGLYGEP